MKLSRKTALHTMLTLQLFAMPMMIQEAIGAEPFTVPQTSQEVQYKGASNLVVDIAMPSHNNNPFGLVYDGAIIKNEEGKVQIHPVTYNLNGNQIAANIYTPPAYDPSKKYKAIVVAHPNGGVKEQVSGLYAQKLAEAGYITIAADAAFQGASGGQPRHLDHPTFREEDIHGMLDIIPSFPGVDPNHLGALGICGGGGYTLKATQTDKRAKAVATVSMFNSGVVRRDGFMNTAKDTTLQRLAEASEVRRKDTVRGEFTLTPALETQDIPVEGFQGMPDLYREGYLYYAKDYAHPNSTFAYTVRSNIDLFAFDAAQNMPLLDQPLLMIAGDKADTLYMTEDSFSKATGTDNKELFLVEGATHIQTYFQPKYVDTIVKKLVSFYNRNL